MQKNNGSGMHDADAETRREAARAMGSARTSAKAAASRANGLAYKGVQRTEEQKERIRLARWGDRPPKEEQPKRPRGRPRKFESVAVAEKEA